MIKFIKILKYQLKPKNIDTFRYLCNVTEQKTDPLSLEPKTLKLNAEIVFYSTLRRASGCIKKVNGSKYIPMDQLKEIPFDLRSFCTKNEWEKGKSTIVRKQFKKAFIADKLLISRKQIFKEIKEVLRQINKAEKQYRQVAVVSHSFRLKILQAFLLTRGRLIDDPKLINNFIHDNKKTFDFGNGFRIAKCG